MNNLSSYFHVVNIQEYNEQFEQLFSCGEYTGIQ